MDFDDRDDETPEALETEELSDFVQTYLRQIAEVGVPSGESTPVPGPSWSVEKAEEAGTYRVRSEEGDEAGVVFSDRQSALLMAALLTAAAQEILGPGGLGAPAEVAEPEEPEVRIARQKESVARVLRALVSNPRAAELFIESVDTDVLREAYEIAQARLAEKGDDKAN
jgi:hypothetical protein